MVRTRVGQLIWIDNLTALARDRMGEYQAQAAIAALHADDLYAEAAEAARVRQRLRVAFYGDRFDFEVE